VTTTDISEELAADVESVRTRCERAWRIILDGGCANGAATDFLREYGANVDDDSSNEDACDAAREVLEDFLELVGVWEGSSRDSAELRGVRVVFTTGGPHIELDSHSREVRGWWGSAYAHVSIAADVCAYYEELVTA
jgi:hypothetical protein